jgi:hypothetical protein
MVRACFLSSFCHQFMTALESLPLHMLDGGAAGA